jgi:hypothetical protein
MTDTTKTEAALKREAYGAATTRLREQHRDDFNNFLVEENGKRGISWQPRKTDEEKAAETLKQILIDFPDLAKQVPQQDANQA